MSHLKEHKFNQYFNDCQVRNLEGKSASHFSLPCHYFTDIQKILNKFQSVDQNILNHSDHETVKLLQYDNNNHKFQQYKIFHQLYRKIRFSGSYLSGPILDIGGMGTFS